MDLSGLLIGILRSLTNLSRIDAYLGLRIHRKGTINSAYSTTLFTPDPVPSIEAHVASCVA